MPTVEDVKHLTMTELEAGLDEIRGSPTDEGVLELIVRRPAVNEREVIESGDLNPVDGLVGDSWKTRRNPRTPDGGPDPDTQLNVMNCRAAALMAGERSRWSLAGDQLFVDFDLSADNLPCGARLAIGAAVIEVTAPPHTGCGKFVSRYGVEAQKFVNSRLGRSLNLRGINARVVQPGAIRRGDVVRKLGAF
jgi:MOSC domain-containing protein YiiM